LLLAPVSKRRPRWATLSAYFNAASRLGRRILTVGAAGRGRILGPLIAVVALFGVLAAPASAALSDVTAQRASLICHSAVGVAGTIDCTPPSPYVQGGRFGVSVYVTQGSGTSLNRSGVAELSGTCPQSGPGKWAATLKAERPFHGGRVMVYTKGFACSADGFCAVSAAHGQEFMLQS
jgi:hypothetical protein